MTVERPVYMSDGFRDERCSRCGDRIGYARFETRWSGSESVLTHVEPTGTAPSWCRFPETATVYAFRVGSVDYPRKVAGPFETVGTARDAAYRERCLGSATGRVHKMTAGEFTVAQRRGTL